MLFQATLIAVIAYLAACYAYGFYLLVKLYTNKRLHAAPANLQDNPHEAQDNTLRPAPATGSSQPDYNAPAKAA